MDAGFTLRRGKIVEASYLTVWASTRGFVVSRQRGARVECHDRYRTGSDR